MARDDKGGQQDEKDFFDVINVRVIAQAEPNGHIGSSKRAILV